MTDITINTSEITMFSLADDIIHYAACCDHDITLCGGYDPGDFVEEANINCQNCIIAYKQRFCPHGNICA